MDKKNKVKYLIKELETLFPVVPVPLDHKDPYTLLIAVLLSAQCTDERVNQITPKLFKKASKYVAKMQHLLIILTKKGYLTLFFLINANFPLFIINNNKN